MFVFITLIILFLPFKNGSTLEILFNEFYNNNWDSISITRIILWFFTWVLLIWNLTIRIMETILYKKKKATFQQQLIDNNIYTVGEEKKAMKLNFKQHEQYVENTISLILDAAISINQPLRGAIVFSIREIINNVGKSRKEKIEEVKKLIKNYGIEPNNVVIAKALKQI